MTVRHGHWIGAKARRPESGASLAAADPRTGQPGDMIAAGHSADIDRAAALHEYFQAKTIGLSLR